MTAPTRVDLNVAAQIPVLHGLKPESLAILLTEASVVNLRPGHPLFRQGEPAVAFFIIVDGWIKLYRVTPAGDEAVLNVLTTGESFAEALTLTSGRYPATACAVTRARVLMIPIDHVVNCIREIPDIAIAMAITGAVSFQSGSICAGYRLVEAGQLDLAGTGPLAFQ